ncbi:MAG: DegT/DnrJ/EryC1/StrS aminotransferase family protein, partial [Bdellovibrionales bacterium]|nr:DegT/DnrJ/EryC1/StrS aminotransferase family protein [Bdellovibrionales bacterium]
MFLKKYSRHTIDFSFNEFIAIIFKNYKTTEVSEFETLFAKFIGTKYAIAIPSCRWGFFYSLKYFNIKSGDDVLIPSYTFEAMPIACRSIGGNVIPVDPPSDSFNIDFSTISKSLTAEAKGVLVSHLYGLGYDMDKIQSLCREKNLFLIEDCAHACGSSDGDKKLGSFGDVGLFSFGLGKGLNTLGGGMLTTNSEELYNYIITQNNLLKTNTSLSIKLLALKVFIMSLLTGALFPYITYWVIF